MISDAVLDALLKSDAERRAKIAAETAPAPPSQDRLNIAHEFGLRLMGGFVREARPAFDHLRGYLTAYGYDLSPLHPAARAGSLALQTELLRSDVSAGYAPLLFALDDHNGDLRIFVQQFGGRQAPDFVERAAPVRDTVDPVWLEEILRDYVACMLRPRVAI